VGSEDQPCVRLRTTSVTPVHVQFAEKFQEVKEAAKLARDKSQEKIETSSNHSQVSSVNGTDDEKASHVGPADTHLRSENDKLKIALTQRYGYLNPDGIFSKVSASPQPLPPGGVSRGDWVLLRVSGLVCGPKEGQLASWLFSVWPTRPGVCVCVCLSVWESTQHVEDVRVCV